MKHTYKIFLITLFTVLLSACNLDVNVDPNRVTDSNVTAQLIFPVAAHETGQRVVAANLGFLNKWLGYWASSGTFAIDFTETTYNITPSFADAAWQAQYNVLFDLKQAERKALADTKPDSLTAGASIILSTLLWQDLVDVWGNAPYTQAFDYVNHPTPAYDDAQAIYNDLQTRLDLAISFMGKTGLTTFPATDIVVTQLLQRDNPSLTAGQAVAKAKTRWIKFANTLKLRLLIRQSEISGNPAAELAKIVANGGVLQQGEGIYVNPGYANAANKQSPFYASYGFTVNASEASPSTRASNYIIDVLGNLTDPRITQLFIPGTSGSVVGNVYGLAAGNPQVSSGVGAGLANSSTQDQWIFTSVESLFLECEAIERGWLPGSAPAKYAEAITESFKFLGVPDAVNAATQYIGTNPWVAVGSFPVSKNTLLQKYIALCAIAPIESWSDLRRISFDIIPLTTASGYTYVSVNPSALGGGQIPIRLLYASSEYTTNAASVGAEGTIDQFKTAIFWDKNGYNN